MIKRRPIIPFWTDDPVRDASRYDAYLEDLDEYDEDYEEQMADVEYEILMNDEMGKE